MKPALHIWIIFLLALCLTSCDVHQWPATRDTMPVNLHLHYEPDFWIWEHQYNQETGIVSQMLPDDIGVDEEHPGTSERYSGMCPSGTMRYIVRAYRAGNWNEFAKEFVFTRDVTDGYDCDLVIELEPGNYEIVVWSDLCENNGDAPYYDASDFRSIDLQYNTNYRACTNYRDGYRGNVSAISIQETIKVTDPEEADIIMRRPMAKFEFIATDLSVFTNKELMRRIAAGRAPEQIDFSNYTVRFYYINYVPVSYSAVSDRLVDSTVGLTFDSQLTELATGEASLGFDYVMLNSNGTSVRVQIGIYDETGEQVAMTPVVDVPLQRDYHTILRGTFMSTDAPPASGGGGVGIDPGFSGEFNVWI